MVNESTDFNFKEMPKTRTEKEEVIKRLVDRLNRTKIAVFVDYSGLNVKKVENLRKSLRQEEVDYEVIKKTLLKLALAKTDFKEIEVATLKGQLGIVFGYQDEILPAKLIKNFQKENESLTILGGILEKKFINQAKVQELASLLSRDELLAKVVYCLRAPLVGLVNVLQGSMKKLIFVLAAIKEQKN